MTHPPAASRPRLPAEWEPQWATLLLWPAGNTRWQPLLRYAQQAYRTLIGTIRRFQTAVVGVPGHDLIEDEFYRAVPGLYPIEVLPCAYDDTWVRDFGPLTLISDQRAQWVDFRFDGWGGRCQRPLADSLAATLASYPTFRHLPRVRHDWVLEGGAIDSDGRGTVLTTTRCLRHRHSNFSKPAVETLLATHVGASRVLWLDHGELLGDPYDGPVDMLARFADPETIVYQGCARSSDPHYPFLAAMAAQLGTFRTAAGGRYRLLELPLPHTIGEGAVRAPANYASFLILNRAVLMPAYGDPDNDAKAAEVLGRAFPDREIVPIDSRVLITQGRGLHAAALQLPAPARAPGQEGTSWAPTKSIADERR